MTGQIRITRGDNPYQKEVQGKANEPITVAALLDRARSMLSVRHLDYSLEEIWDRLEENAPRVAIIGGSPDHPAHIFDFQTTARAAIRIWENGGVPFSFATPVLCDGTAQSTTGMCYSLESRNAMTQMIVNQMEAQCYHGAFVIQGCDKQPLAAVAALAALDVTRKARGDAPVFATFAPAHVLKGGTIPPDLRREIEDVATLAERQGHAEIADDLRDALAYVLQCSSNQAFQGVLSRAVATNLITHEHHKQLEKQLGVNTCDSKGGHLRVQRHRKLFPPCCRGAWSGPSITRAAHRASRSGARKCRGGRALLVLQPRRVFGFEHGQAEYRECSSHPFDYRRIDEPDDAFDRWSHSRRS